MRKYGNKPRGGFDSRKEERVYYDLMARRLAAEPAERVVDIQRQVRFVLLPAQRDATGKLIERQVAYIADFVVRYADNHSDVIDVKSPITRTLPAYVLKRKMMLFTHGLRVVEV